MVGIYGLIGFTIGILTGALGGSRGWGLLPTLLLSVGLTAAVIFPLSYLV